MIYLDHNATTPVDPEVKDTIVEALDAYGNPSSSHRLGMLAHEVVELSRERIANLIGASPDEVFFTSGGTESNNLAILGLSLHQGKGHIISSTIEHPSVKNPLTFLEGMGFDVTYIGTDKNGLVDPEDVKKGIRSDTILVTIMHSNNETGVIQPVSEIAGILKERGIPFHTDAAQSLGKVAVDVNSLGADMLTVVSHKFYGPKGVGAIYLRNGMKYPKPIMYGAGHERGLRPGTENVPGIAGLGKASEIASRDMENRLRHVTGITKLLYGYLLKSIPCIMLNGENAPSLPNTLNISIPGICAIELVDALKETVAISAGAACHSGVSVPSGVLLSMGLSRDNALSAVRISTGKDNTTDDIVTASGIIAEAVNRLRK